MDIRLFCCRCFVFLGLWVGYEAKDGNQTTHQRTDDVEEAEGEIDKCRDTKNRTLRHTAGCPWNRYALRLAGHQSPRHILRDGTALL